MTKVTKSLNYINPVCGENGKKVVEIPSQPPHPVSFRHIDSKDFTVTDKSDTCFIIQLLEKYGVCIVKNFLPAATCDSISKEVEPHFFRENNWNGSPFPRQTTVVTRAVLKSEKSIDSVLCNPLFVDISNNFLQESNYFWIGDRVRTGNSSIQINSSIVYKVGPGASDQRYHREDMPHHNIHEEATEYIYGTESLVGISVALTTTTEGNGATRGIPGSHLWGRYRSPVEGGVYVELEKGDCVLLLGSVYHAASANNTSDDRISLFYFMTKSYLKQEENLLLDHDFKFFTKFSATTLGLLGLRISDPFCGHVDYKNPVNILKNMDVEEEYYSETIYIK